MQSFNLFDGELDLERDQPGFGWRAARVGERIGGEQLGATLYELSPESGPFRTTTSTRPRSGSW